MALVRMAAYRKVVNEAPPIHQRHHGTKQIILRGVVDYIFSTLLRRHFNNAS